MATPTPSPAETKPATAGDVPVNSWISQDSTQDLRQTFSPDDSLRVNFGGESSTFSQVDLTPKEGFSGIKVQGLDDGPIRAPGNLTDVTPIYFLFLLGAALFYIIWRIVKRSGRANFAGQDGNR